MPEETELVWGNMNEEEVINRLKMYMNQSELLEHALNESYRLYRFGNNSPLTEALDLVLEAMHHHLTAKSIQISASANIFYITPQLKMTESTKRRVVSALINGMEAHIDDNFMIRNCCLALCQFDIPEDVMIDYGRFAKLLVSVLHYHADDLVINRVVVLFLDTLVYHVKKDQIALFGKCGAAEVILDQINRKLISKTCDDVMTYGWRFLWNITDETPENCKLFCAANGLEVFRKCYESFKAEKILVRNMVGAIGNIVENDDLRHGLMKKEYCEIFLNLLKSQDESIENSFNSCGVLANLVGDGEKCWKDIRVSREDGMQKMVETISKWPLDSCFCINYRSFCPILRLLPLYHAHASQHWAVWTLACFTKMDGMKYCPMVRDEGGVPLLEELAANPATNTDIQILANTVLHNVNSFDHELINED